MRVELCCQDMGRFGDFAEVKVYGITVATVQGVAEEDLNKKAVREWANAAFEGMSLKEVLDLVKYGGVHSLNPNLASK